MILSDYINYDRAVEGILKDQPNKKTAETNLRMRLNELEQEMSSVSAIDTEKEPVDGGEYNDKSLNLVIEKQETIKKLNDIYRFNAAYNLAWNKLNEEEQLVLKEFYQSGYIRRQDAVDVLCETLHCEVASVYRRKTAAVKKFKKLLIG
ncbi:MAG: hypothetical protein LKJ75_02485 [Clostridia bacterium]|jgi:predicted transcriptional regulator YheO|nr:hypothetical protein [Clostridia bacterium]MCI2014051.1 hypothetical protein [Clostridia bacterium]